MLRSIAELAAYGTFAVLLAVASLAPGNEMASSATTSVLTTSDTTPPASTIVVERGALLFAVKGCVGCHMHSALPSARMQVGPDLTAVALQAGARVAGLDADAYVRQSLLDPGAYRAAGSAVLMPDLRLRDDEVEALTAFLLTPPR